MSVFYSTESETEIYSLKYTMLILICEYVPNRNINLCLMSPFFSPRRLSRAKSICYINLWKADVKTHLEN